MLKQPDEIRGAYARTRTAEEYIDRRFTSAWGSVMHQAQVRAVNDVIRRQRARRVIEIAPGPARLSREIHGFERGYLCEFNESMVAVAQRRLQEDGSRWRIVRGDGFHLPFTPTIAADLIYTFRFIRHFEAAHRTALYRQVRSALKDGGWFVFDAVNEAVGRPWSQRFAPQHDVYDEFYSRATLEAELRAHGFALESLTDVMRHMSLQQRIQVLVDPRSHRLARRLITALERIPGDPLEWIVVCRKVPA